MKKSKSKSIRNSIIMILMLAAILIYSVSIFVKNKDAKTDVESVEPGAKTELEKLLQKDLNINYPPTPREVVKLYNRIIKCFYNEKLSEEELVQLGNKARFLFDKELLDSKSEEVYFKDLKAEIKDYKDHDRTIANSKIQEESEVQKKTIGKKEYVQIQTTYFLKEGTKNNWVYETYMLREEDDGRWKILGWEITPPAERDQ